MKQPVDLEKLVDVEGFLYDTAIYRCAYLKDKKTRGKVSIFAMGKNDISWCQELRRSKNMILHMQHDDSQNLLGLIRSTKIIPKIQNIVATADLGNPIYMENLTRKLPNVIYEPEQFPG